MQKHCSNCNSIFICSVNEISNCWCNQYPAILEIKNNTDCLCEKCLHQQVKINIQEIEKSINSFDTLNNNWIKELPKQNKLLENIDYYIENGLFVFTKWYHLKRGYCCKNNCKHCAYGYAINKNN